MKEGRLGCVSGVLRAVIEIFARTWSGRGEGKVIDAGSTISLRLFSG